MTNKTTRLPQEQAPTDNPKYLLEWLTRLVILINGVFDQLEQFLQDQLDDHETRITALEGGVSGQGYVTKLEGSSFNIQAPIVENAPEQIEFGAAQANPDVEIDANGTVTFNKAAQYEVDLLFHAGRSNNGGNVPLVIYSEQNGSPHGQAIAVSLNSNADIRPISLTSLILDTAVNDTYEFFMYRHTNGQNDGGLRTLGSTVPGVPNSPSAWIRIREREV